MSRARWLDRWRPARGSALPEPVFRYVAAGRPRRGDAARGGRRLARAPVPAARAARRARGRHRRCTLLGHAVRPARRGRADDAAAGGAPRRRGRDGPRGRAAGVPLVVSSNAGSTFADIAATGVHLVAAGLRRRRPRAGRAAARAGGRGRRRGGRAHRRHPGASAPSYAGPATPTRLGRRRPGLAAGQLRPRATGRSPAPEKATDLGPHDLGWLAEATGLPVVVKGVLRADDARRCVEAGARGGLGVQPRRPPARPGASRRPAACAAVREAVGGEAEVYVDGGVRSGLDVLRRRWRSVPTRSSSAGRRSTRWPPEGADGVVPRPGRARRRARSSRCASPGAPTLAATAGIACPDRGFGALKSALTCVNRPM